jgi:hypothetical protein
MARATAPISKDQSTFYSGCMPAPVCYLSLNSVLSVEDKTTITLPSLDEDSSYTKWVNDNKKYSQGYGVASSFN